MRDSLWSLSFLSKEEPMDMEKINRLKQQIENGTYKVDSRILAKKIVEKL